MRVRQQYRKTGKKYAESGCCVYNIYAQFFFAKSVYVKYRIFGSTYTKNAYTYIHTFKRCQ